MKRGFVLIAAVLMFGAAAFAPFTPTSHNETVLLKVTPTRPPATPVAPVKGTATAPGRLTAPTLLAPANGSTVHTGNVTFSWAAVPGAARYHLQAGGGPALDQQYNIIEYWGLTQPSYTFNITPGFVVYFPRLYWRVQAIDANHVQGPWSQVWSFNIVSP